jgi:glycosyltransferase involved in cell wall biosynthesis
MNPRRRLLYVIGKGALGGRELQLARLAPAVADHGWSVAVVFAREGGPIEQQLRQSGITTIVTERSGQASIPKRLRHIHSLAAEAVRSQRFVDAAIRSVQPAIVHAMLPASVYLAVGAARRQGAAAIAGVYGAGPRLRSAQGLAYRRGLRCADVVLCNAPHLGSEVVSTYGVDQRRVRWIANGVQLPQQAATRSLPASPTTAVVVANFHAYKGYDVLVEALTFVRSPVTVRCCGIGPERSAILERASELGVMNRLVIVDPPADVPAELLAAQLAIHPSRTEGLSNAVLEEMAAGLPVIASRVGGNPVLIEDGSNGLLVPPGDPRALASAIDRLAADPELRSKMGAASRSAAQRYSWESCVLQHLELYEELLRRGKA